MKYLIVILTMAASSWGANRAVSETEQWDREFNLGKQPTLYLRNVYGTIEIVAHDADTILVAATETRRARRQEDLERARDKIFLAVTESDGLLELEVTGPERERRNWHCRYCDLGVDYSIKVPRQTSLDIANVNEGEIRITGVTGLIDAHHVNDSIEIRQAHQCGAVNSVNGQIHIGFAKSPTDDCAIHTINGDMTIALPDQPNINLALNLHNGDVRSDFDVAPRATAAKVEQQRDGSGHRYRISRATGLQLGNGGAELSFDSINGSVRIEHLD